MPTISVVVLTHSRCHLLRQCVENVLQRSSTLTTQIVICDNASTDETAAYLDSLDDPRIEVVRQSTNIGVNAYARLFPRCTGDYLVELDDDVIDAPAEWDRTLLEAFEQLPEIGYLAANLVHNPHDVTSGVMYGVNAHLYRTEEVAGVRLKVGGPVGGWCSLTSRELHDRVGGWSEQEEAFWQEEGIFLERAAGTRLSRRLPRGSSGRPRGRSVLLADAAREARVLALVQPGGRPEEHGETPSAEGAGARRAQRSARVVRAASRAARLCPPLRRRRAGADARIVRGMLLRIAVVVALLALTLATPCRRAGVGRPEPDSDRPSRAPALGCQPAQDPAVAGLVTTTTPQRENVNQAGYALCGLLVVLLVSIPIAADLATERPAEGDVVGRPERRCRPVSAAQLADRLAAPGSIQTV